MALTYRTGSGEHPGKGSALTIEEVDNNFRHFTGSHSISGSLIISSSLADSFALVVSGSVGISGSIIPDGAGMHSLGNADNYFEELFLSYDSLIFVSGSVSSSFSVDPSGSLSGSFDGGFSGSFSGSLTGSIDGTEIYINNLPTSEPAESGRLWLSGSFSSSKYLMVRD